MLRLPVTIKAYTALAACLVATVTLPAFAQGTDTVTAGVPDGLRAGDSFRECDICPEMVVIPAGNFVMGAPEDEPGRFDNEGPQHAVEIARPFAMGTANVTVAQYRAFVEDTGHPTAEDCRIIVGRDLVRVAGPSWQRPNFWQADDHPVVCVSRGDALAYIAWLNSRISPAATDSLYRLPSEAEWEYAARGGTVTAFYWGSEMSREQANYGLDELVFETDEEGERTGIFEPRAEGGDHWEYTSPARAFPANPFGLYDMAGNVWQLTSDCWNASYDGAPHDGSSWREGSCDEGVVRGGSWLKPPIGERSAKRGLAAVDDLAGNHEIGFRVVRDLPTR